MRTSRLLACATLVAGLGVLVGRSYDLAAIAPYFAALMSPLSALCAIVLSLAAVAMSVPAMLARGLGQLLAVLGFGIALPSTASRAVEPWFNSMFGPVIPLADTLLPATAANGMSGATSLMLGATALALFFVPMRSRLGTQLFSIFAALGLLATVTSLVGLLLGSATLASFGLAAMPTPLTNAVAGLLLLATLAQRGDADWMSVLLGPSAAGSSARGIIAWTVVAPLAFASLALAGVRNGLYSLHFAFALLAATVCCGLTALVIWNAARVERAQRRATSARDAEQLAASRLRLAKSATGIQMWEWLPATREWYSIDGAERLDPSTNEHLDAGLARTLRDGKSEFEFPVRRAGHDEHARDERWMFATCWRELRESESIVAGITVDITDRRRAALALEASETRLQLAARALPGFVYDWNCASGKIQRTSGIELMLGYQGAEISPVSRWWEDLLHPEDRALAMPARVARASRRGQRARQHRLRISRAAQARRLRVDLGSLRAGARSRWHRHARGRQRARHHRAQGSRSKARGQRISLQGRPAGHHRHHLDTLAGRSRSGRTDQLERVHRPEQRGTRRHGLARSHPSGGRGNHAGGLARCARDRRYARDDTAGATARRRVPHFRGSCRAGDRRARTDRRMGGRAHRHHRTTRSRAARARKSAAPGAGARCRQRRHVGLGPHQRHHDMDAPDSPHHRHRARHIHRRLPNNFSRCCCPTARITPPRSCATSTWPTQSSNPSSSSNGRMVRAAGSRIAPPP